MPTRYFGRHEDLARRTVSTSGTQGGPPGGDGWTVVSTLPGDMLSETPRRYAFWVTGRISNLQKFGAVPPNATGRLQLCLAGGGVRSTVHLFHMSPEEVAGPWDGVPFTFLVIFRDGAGDPEWGPSWPGNTDLRIEGRLFWGNDTPTYSISWDVSDVSFVWMDLESIPPEDQATHVDTGQVALPAYQGGTIQGQSMSGERIAEVDENWLVFSCVHFQPPPADAQTGQLSQPYFAFGTSGENINTASVGSVSSVIGTLPSHGLQWLHRGGGDRFRTLGGLYHKLGTVSGGEFFGLLHAADFASPGTTFRGRFSAVAIRLDNLPAVLVRAEEQIDDFTDYDDNPLQGTRFLSLEVGPQQLSWEPFVFAGAVVHQTQSPARRGYALHLSDDLGELYSAPVAYAWADRQHNMQHMLSSSNGIGFGDDAFRYLLRCLKPGLQSTLHQSVRDVYLIVLHPIRDPDGQEPTIPSVGDPVPVVPGAEGPPVSSLAKLPLVMNAAIREAPLDHRERLVGSTGYVRSWGVWLKSRRTFSVSWSPVSTADRDSIVATIRAASLWQMTPPKSSEAIAVASIGEPQVAHVSGSSTWSVTVEVAELVYTV